MPIICLANANVPGGVLQITDLWPNVSQQNNAVDPPGQTRYLRRPALDRVQVNATSGLVEGFRATAAQATFEGLHAYLMDKVEPAGLTRSTASITLVAPGVGDQVVIKGLFFQFQAGGNPVNWAGITGAVGDPFLVGLGAGVNDAAANLTLAINDAGDVIPAFAAAAPANVHPVATNVGAPSAIVQLDAATDPGAVALLGPDGDLTLTTNDAVNVLLPAVGRMSRGANDRWTAANLLATANALMARVDGGLAMTLAAVNVVLAANAGAELTNAGGSNSVGTLAELLSILAGRVYRVPVGAVKFAVAVAPNTVHVWDATIRGSFTTPVTVFDSQMLGGEIRPNARWVKHGKEKQSVVSGGDVQNNEVGGVRSVQDTTHFQASLQNGQLRNFATAGLTLFPDNDLLPFVSTQYQRTQQAAIVGARVVTVYDDDGSLLV